jgi:LD-carboxypeptidase C-terminal domain
VHLGPGPGVDDVHARSLRAALLTGETLELTDPGESEDIGIDWGDPRALTSFGDREPTEPWSWHGPARSVTGRTWGGCLEVIDWILAAGRFPFQPAVLDGAVTILETSEELLPARHIGWIVRSFGERGILPAVDAVLVARPPVSDFTRRPAAEERARLRAAQRDVIVGLVSRYNPDAVVCRHSIRSHPPTVDRAAAAPSPSTALHIESSPTTPNPTHIRAAATRARRSLNCRAHTRVISGRDTLATRMLADWPPRSRLPADRGIGTADVSAIPSRRPALVARPGAERSPAAPGRAL